MKHTIKVTQDNILHGYPNDCGMCPVALALEEAFPSYAFEVGGQFIEVRGYSTGFTHKVPTPQLVKDFIYHYDRQHNGNPFNFVFEHDFA